MNARSDLPDESSRKDPTGDISAPTRDLPPAVLAHLELLRRAGLWPLHADRPLTGLVQGVEINGWMSFCIMGSEVHKRTFTAKRTADNPPSFEFGWDEWPTNYRPVCVVLGQFTFPKVEPGRLEIVSLWSKPRDEGEQNADTYVAPISLAAAADDSDEAIELLSAEDMPEVMRGIVVSQGSDGGVWVGVDNGACEFVVVELHGKDLVGRLLHEKQVIHFEESGQLGLREKKIEFQRGNDLGPEPAQVTARNLEAADLHLLSPTQATDFLTGQNFLTMPIEEVDGRFTCCARWPAQQRLAAAPTTTWALQVAMPEAGKEDAE